MSADVQEVRLVLHIRWWVVPTLWIMGIASAVTNWVINVMLNRVLNSGIKTEVK